MLKAKGDDTKDYMSLLAEKDKIIVSLQKAIDELKEEFAKYKENNSKEFESISENYKNKCNELQIKEAEKAELDAQFKGIYIYKKK